MRQLKAKLHASVALLFASLILAAILGGLAYALRKKSSLAGRRLAAVLVILAGNQLAGAHLIIDGTNYLPIFLGPSLAAIAGTLRFRLATDAERFWRWPFLVLPALTALWSWWAWFEDSHIAHGGGIALLALHLFLAWRTSHHRGIRKRALAVSREQWAQRHGAAGSEGSA